VSFGHFTDNFILFQVPRQKKINQNAPLYIGYISISDRSYSISLPGLDRDLTGTSPGPYRDLDRKDWKY
jgi:hypothetical protein